MNTVLAIDIGGTLTKIGIVKAAGMFGNLCLGYRDKADRF